MVEDITLLFCFVDDFCKEYENLVRSYSIEKKKMRKPTRVSGLKISEIITIILLFYRSNMMNFKAFYKYLELHHKGDFPKMPTYERFCAIKQKAIPILSGLFKCILSKGQSEAYIDATALRVSHNKRTNSHKVFKGIAAVGKSTMGWFYGFKLHLVIDLQGNIINAKLTRGNCDDRSPVEDLLQEFQGVIYGYKGYISQDLFGRLWKKGVKLVTGVKANMKNKLMILKEKILLKKRSLIESVFSVLKRNGLEHSRHRSVHGFILHILGSLVSYQLNRKKTVISDGYSLPNP